MDEAGTHATVAVDVVEQLGSSGGSRHYVGTWKLVRDPAGWLLDDNPAGEPMYHPVLGGCYDGITEDRVNRNLGAESSIEAGRAELYRHRCEQAAPRRSRRTLTLVR